MRVVKIFGKALKSLELKALLALAIEAGCDTEEIEVIASIGEPDLDCEDEVLLILATPATCSLPNLEKDMSRAANGARRVIWVWPENTETGEVPEPTKKFAYSILPWDAEKLSAVIADDDVVCFEAPTGEPLPKEETERNICVDEVKNQK